MSEKHGLILLIQEDPAIAGSVRDALGHNGDGLARLQCIKSLPTALARIAGGGVDAVVIDLCHGWAGENEALEAVRQVRRSAPHAPIIALHPVADEALATRALRAGATGHVPREHCGERLGPQLQAARGLDPEPPASKPGETIVLLGAKGGVGATTVALNLACLLAQSRKVILAEVRPDFGTLAHYFAPHGLARNMAHALRGDPAHACLWSSKTVPGLSVLFGPQTGSECGPLEPDRARALMAALASLADYVVVDLPSSLSTANRAIIEGSDTVMLVVERDPACVQSARLMTSAIEEWSGAPQPIEMVLVNRVALVSPMSLSDIDAQLGRSPLAVIPPGPDLCATAQSAHLPLVALQPESLLAGSLISLCGKLGPSVAPMPREHRPEPQHA